MTTGHRRVSLYGVSLCLPADWEDWTDYLFEFKGTPLQSLLFGVGALPDEHIQPWLEYKRKLLLGLDGVALASAVERYAHPSARVYGFQTKFDEATSSSAYVDLIVLARAENPLRITCRAQAGYKPDLEAIITSIEPKAPSGPLGPNRYRVHDASFASPFEVTTPQLFSFSTPDESKEGECRLVARWKHLAGASTPSTSRLPAAGESTGPAAVDWRTEFNLFEPRNLQPEPVEERTHALAGLQVHEARHFTEVDDVIGDEREHHTLTLGRAKLTCAKRELTLEYHARSGRDRARHEWRCLVQSLQNE